LSGEFQILRLNHNNKHLLSAIENDIVVDSHLTFQIIDNKIYYSILNVTPYIKKCEINEFAISDYIDSENKIIFFAIQNNECIGQIRIRKYWNNYAYIDDIVVDKNYRRKNIGTKLLDAAKEWARTNKLIGLRVYPAIGGLPRTVNGEVNGLATRLAQKLGGEAASFFAPAFAENENERDTIFGLTHVIRSLDLARNARVGLFGIGSLHMDSSIIRYCPLPYHQLAELVERSNGVGEILGYIYDSQGEDCGTELSKLVIGISLDDVRKIPVRIGVAGGKIKAPAIAAAIKGKYFSALIIDENAARSVIEILQGNCAA